MKIKILSVLTILAASALAHAGDTAGAHAADPELKPGEITTGANGKRGRVAGANGNEAATLQIAPNSKVTIDPPTKDGPISIKLEAGMLRVRAIAKADHKPVLNLKTRAAVMGVRGTDFVGIATPILGEAEIVVLEGKVEFASATDSKDAKLVGAGYWGGIGGRFGAKTHELIHLSAEQLQHFDQASTVK